MFKRILCAFIIIIVTSSFIGCSKTKEYHSPTNQFVMRELINSPSQSYRFKLEQNKRRPSPVQKVEKVSKNQNDIDVDTLIEDIKAQVESSKQDYKVLELQMCHHPGAKEYDFAYFIMFSILMFSVIFIIAIINQWPARKKKSRQNKSELKV